MKASRSDVPLPQAPLVARGVAASGDRGVFFKRNRRARPGEDRTRLFHVLIYGACDGFRDRRFSPFYTRLCKISLLYYMRALSRM